jgi:DNA-binding transcriptional MerR regulator
LDYWARTGLVVPSVRPAAGSGSARLYSFTDILVLKLVKRLLEAGITLQNIRVVVDQLRGRDAQELSAVTLLCDGSTVYECVDDDQVIDLLRGGQGVFAVAIGVSISELAVAVAELPAEAAVAAEDPANFGGVDELSRRRARRSA